MEQKSRVAIIDKLIKTSAGGSLSTIINNTEVALKVAGWSEERILKEFINPVFDRMSQADILEVCRNTLREAGYE